jgi:hypothetical protein
MSRIYQSQQAETRYQGSARSADFVPEQVVSSEQKLRQYKEATIQDAETMGREISRQMQLDQAALSYQQEAARGRLGLQNFGEKAALGMKQQYESNSLRQQQSYEASRTALEGTQLRGSQSVANATLQATQTAIQGLLSLSSTALKFQEQQLDRQEKIKQENAILDSIVDNFEEFVQVKPVEQEQSKIKDTVIKSESTALNKAADALAGSNDPIDLNAETKLRQGTTWNQLSSIRGNVYAGRAMFPVALGEAAASGAIRPGAQGLEDARQFTRDFIKRSGLIGVDKSVLASVFAPTALAAIQNTVMATTQQEAKQVREANLARVQAVTSELADGTSAASVGADWQKAADEHAHGNIGFNGQYSSALNYQVTEDFLKNLAENKNTAAIQALREHEVVPGNKGTKLGKQFDHLFDKYEKEARVTAIQDFNMQQTEQSIALKQSIQFYYDNPSPENRQKAIDQLRSIGSEDALNEASKLAQFGLSYDPQKKFDLLEMEQRGVEIPESMLKSLLSKGTISDAEYKQFSKAGPEKAAFKNVDDYIKNIDSGLKASMQGTAGAQDLTPDVRAELNIRHRAMIEELRSLVGAEVKVNPGIANSPTELARVIESKTQYLLNQPRYKLDNNGGGGWKFGAEIKADQRLARITVGPGVQDFSKISPEDAFGKLKFPKSEMDATKDNFLQLNDLKADVKRAVEGKEVSNKTRLWARNLGLSSTAFIEAQLGVRGLPSLRAIKSGTAMEVIDIKDASAGYRHLKSMGFPTKGAAFIAGNIQQESGWHGLRDWGEVSGDGTNRNGGLISWASWANNPARLGAIERHFGRPIKQIPETDQLAYMKLEMQRRNPQAYRVFMNPNATENQLRWASYQYWGYGHEGGRYAYAQNLIKYGRI